MSISTLRDQRIVVIGGSSGIGLAVAEGALAEGARVVVGSSGAANVEAAVARLGEGASGAVANVRDEVSVAAFFEGVGAFDHLVFTAGDWGANFGGGLVAEMDLAASSAGFTVRFWGALIAVKHAQGRISTAGSITLTDGVLAHRPQKGMALATAMAGAIEHLTRALAVDLAPLRVNAVCPGLADRSVEANARGPACADDGAPARATRRRAGGSGAGLPLSDAGRLHDRPGAGGGRRADAGVKARRAGEFPGVET